MIDDKTSGGGQTSARIHVREDRESRDLSRGCGVMPEPLNGHHGARIAVAAHRLCIKRWTVAMAAIFGLVAFSGAQPTGNPKGTLPAPETSAPKPSAARTPKAGNSGTDEKKLVGTEAQSRARIQGATPPGTGTAGGLPGRQSNEASRNGAARSDKGSAAPRPLPPSK